MRPLRFICAILTFLGVSLFAYGQSGSRSDKANGRFIGSASSVRAGQLAVTLNVIYTAGHFSGSLATPVGTFSITGGRFDGDHIHLDLTSGADAVTVDASFDGDVWAGTFASADDSGTLRLHRASAAGAEVPAEKAQLSSQQWHEDLKFLARELPLRHADAFHYIIRKYFDHEISALDRDLDRLDSDQIYVRMDQIETSIGDGHTYVNLPADDASFPIYFERFGNDLRVVATTELYKAALGARVLKVHETPIGQAEAILMGVTPAGETIVLRQARVNSFLRIGIFQHGERITPRRDVADYTLKNDDGHVFKIDVRAEAPNRSDSAQLLTVYAKRPLFRQCPDESFWSVYLPDSRTIYCSFRGYQGLADKARGLFEQIKKFHPKKLVVDLRLNGGGDYFEGLRYVVQPIRRLRSINRRGNLFVLIGPKTFSAAMSNSAHFRYQTKAILVGQQIGERPNSYQEVREFRLPNSHWTARYSTKYYKFVARGANIILPDREIVPTWAEYRSGKDPVLEWVLKYKSGRIAGTPPAG